MPINPEWNLDSIKSEIEEWLANKRDFIHGRAHKMLSDYAAGGAARGVPISRNLSKLFSWYGAEGAAALLSGKKEGLTLLYRAHTYNAVYFRLRCALHQGKLAGPTDLNEASLILAESMALGLVGEVDWIGRQFITFLPKGLFDGMDSTRAAPFIFALYLQWRQLPVSLKDFPTIPFHSMEGYELLLKVWNISDDKQVAKALAGAADFHTLRSGDPTEEKLTEFSDYVYRVWPVEILAVLRARELNGLSNPDVKHPLLQSPLGKLWPVQEPPPDDLLNRVTNRLAAEFPGF